MTLSVAIQIQDFDVSEELAALRRGDARVGAVCCFVGTVRERNESSAVASMELEHYPGMTEKQLALCVEKAQGLWSILDSLIIHRVGTITPNEVIVLIAVWSSHRGDAFDATRYIMEALKSTVPFWKKECLETEAERWVMSNTSGYQ